MKIYIGEYFYENQSLLQNKRIGRVVRVEHPGHPHLHYCTIKWFVLSEDEGSFATYSLLWLEDLIESGCMGYYYPLVEITQ